MTELFSIPSTVTLSTATVGNYFSGNDSVKWPTGDREDANRHVRETLIPCMVIVGIFMLIGITGNSLTCYIFGFRMRHGTQNFFIVMLAIFDLLSCTIGMPAEIADMALHYKFDSAPACKMMRFVNTFTALCSISTLLVIAVDRYRRVHKPHQTQISYGRAKWCLVPVIGASLVFSWPALIVYGIRTVDTRIPGVQGTDCTISDEVKHTIYPLVYNAVLFGGFIIFAVSLIVMYSRILYGLRKHLQNLRKTSVNSPTLTERSSAVQPGTPKNNMVTPLQPADLVQGGHANMILSSKEPVPSLDKASSTNAWSIIQGNTKIDDNEDDAAEGNGLPESLTPTKTPETRFDIDTSDAKEDSFSDPSTSDPKDITGIAISGDDQDTLVCTREGTGAEESNHKQSRYLDQKMHDHECAKVNATDSGISQTLSGPPKAISSGTELDNSHTESPSYGRQTSEAPLLITQGKSSELPRTCINPLYEHESSITIKEEDLTEKHEPLKTTRSAKGVPKDRRNITKKTTIIVFVVTIVFILSFVPHLCLQVVHLIKKGLDEKLEGAGFALYNLFLRSYFINNLANPIIYGAMNEQFRQEVKRLFQRLHCRQ